MTYDEDDLRALGPITCSARSKEDPKRGNVVPAEGKHTDPGPISDRCLRPRLGEPLVRPGRLRPDPSSISRNRKTTDDHVRSPAPPASSKQPPTTLGSPAAVGVRHRDREGQPPRRERPRASVPGAAAVARRRPRRPAERPGSLRETRPSARRCSQPHARQRGRRTVRPASSQTTASPNALVEFADECSQAWSDVLVPHFEALAAAATEIPEDLDDVKMISLNGCHRDEPTGRNATEAIRYCQGRHRRRHEVLCTAARISITTRRGAARHTRRGYRGARRHRAHHRRASHDLVLGPELADHYASSHRSASCSSAWPSHERLRQVAIDGGRRSTAHPRESRARMTGRDEQHPRSRDKAPDAVVRQHAGGRKTRQCSRITAARGE